MKKKAGDHLKFIHIADVHWGARPDRDRSYGKVREKEIKETFQRVIEKANEDQIDLLLIAGDFFDQMPRIGDLREVDYLLSRLVNARTVLIAGNHDHMSDGDAWSEYEWQSEVYFLDGIKQDHITFQDLDTTVYGFSYQRDQIKEALYDHMKPEDTTEISILLAHGGDELHIPIKRDALKWSGFDYIALGHIHKPEIIFEDLMAYAGSLEPLDHTETGDHGLIEGEISDEKKQICFVPFAKRKYTQVEVMISDQMSEMEIYDRIETELSYRGRENIYEIVLIGGIDPQIKLDFYNLKREYLVSDIIDETKSCWDYEEVVTQDDVVLQEVAKILKEEPRALSYAMEALSYAREN